MNKEGSYLPLIFVMGLSLIVAALWDQVTIIKETAHNIFDPSAGALLNWNLTIGMLIVVFIITLFTTLVQKYATDQKALKELREEQKLLQKEIEKFKDHPEKMAELSKKQLEFLPRTMKLTSRGLLFTGVPFILFFRWFHDTFTTMGDPVFLGFMNWFWFYFISAIVFGSILRKMLKVV